MYCLETERQSESSPPVQAWNRAAEPTLLQEPITLAEAKRQCGIADAVEYHDQLLSSLIAAARQQVESDTGIVCYTGSFSLKLTQFPDRDWIELPAIRPVTAASSITYVDSAGATQTWSSANYVLESAAVQPFIRLAYGQSWPTVRGDINGITVTIAAGYASVAAVPRLVKQACLFLVNHWFVHRDIVSVVTISPDVSLTYDAIVRGLMRSSYP